MKLQTIMNSWINFRATALVFLQRVFGRAHSATRSQVQEVAAEPEPVAAEPVAAEPEQEQQQQRARQERRSRKSLCAWLDEINATFDSLWVADFSGAALPSHTKNALRTHGPIVCYQQEMLAIGREGFFRKSTMFPEEDEVPTVPVDKTFPFAMFRAFNFGAKPVKGACCPPDFDIAFRSEKLPPCVERKPNSIYYEYLCGFRYHGRIAWVSTFVAVDRCSGVVTGLREVRPRAISVGSRHDVFHRKCLVEPLDSKGALRFVSLVRQYQDRENYWEVLCAKGTRRVRFLVPDNDAKWVFSDRDKTVATTINGRRRPIIHFVEEHQRLVRGEARTVKAHLRGQRRFFWKELSVAVSAPKFHFVSAQCDVASVISDDDVKPAGYFDVDEVGGALAAYEESQSTASLSILSKPEDKEEEWTGMARQASKNLSTTQEGQSWQ